MENRISDDALKGLPGDSIEHWSTSDKTEKKWSVIKTVGWTFTPKGGRIYTYETTENELIANDLVLNLKKLQKPVTPSYSLELPPPRDLSMIMDEIMEIESLPASLRVAAVSVLKDDYEHLKVAEFLLRERIKGMNEIFESLAEGDRIDNEIDL